VQVRAEAARDGVREGSVMTQGSVGSPWLWAGFVVLVLVLLSLDLGLLHRRDRAVRPREALVGAACWFALAMAFAGGVWWRFGSTTALEFVTGYLVEQSLSVDNLFVFVVLFRSLAIPATYQHRVLFWGVLTAFVLRAIMILGGAALLHRFGWLIYVFGGFLLVTGVKLLLVKEGDAPAPQDNAVFRLVRRLVPTTHQFHGHAFLAVEGGRRVATPLLVALVFIEVSDVVFAVDSIPAVFGVTRDPFVVFTSNIFAVLGLRTLYFLLANLVEKFTYLKPGLAAVLIFVGAKMLGGERFHLPAAVSLAVIVSILGLAVLASWWKSRRDARAEPRDDLAGRA
jgi:tellurite resistance protein TerC